MAGQEWTVFAVTTAVNDPHLNYANLDIEAGWDKVGKRPKCERTFGPYPRGVLPRAR